MTKTNRTRSNGSRAPDFVGSTEALRSDRVGDNGNLRAPSTTGRVAHEARIKKVLHDLIVAESWESMALESAARSEGPTAVQPDRWR